MSYYDFKEWPKAMVRVEAGEIVETRLFDTAEDVPADAGWMTKDAFRALSNATENTAEAGFQPQAQSGETEETPAPRRRKKASE